MDTVSKAREVKAASQGTGRRYKVDIGRASEGGVDTGLSRTADGDVCVVSWSVRCKLSGTTKISSRRVSRCEDRAKISSSVDTRHRVRVTNGPGDMKLSCQGERASM